MTRPDPRRLMLIGVGPHSVRFYLPALAAARPRFGVTIVAAVELEGQGERTRAALAACGHADATVLEVPTFEGPLPVAMAATLDAACQQHGIGSVIVATEPMAHLGYALWAIDRGHALLLDKPISTRRNAAHDLDAARGIAADFELLATACRRAAASRQPVASICAHRRFHPGIREVLKLVAETSGQTGCPATSIHCHHSDGQWRFPLEMLTQEHHSYHHGHGKASHSGHHFLDCIWLFWRAGAAAAGVTADRLRVVASMIPAEAHVAQLPRATYERLFGADYAAVCPLPDDELRRRLRACGELDVSGVATFMQDELPLCNASFDLQHTGFSRRAWSRPPADLYKGNGRVKHEHQRVHVGPFRAIHVHSYQAVDQHDQPDAADLLPGGRNHYEIIVFTNTEMIGGTAAVEHLNLADLAPLGDERLHIEQIKDGVVEEFLGVATGMLPVTSLASPLLDHALPTRLLSALYESHVLLTRGGNPVVELPLDPVGGRA
jgi:predicted dehydrogenase